MDLGSTTSGGRTGLTKTAQRILRSQKNAPAPTLFMGNLSFETKEDDIRDLLETSARRHYVDETPEGEAPAPPSAGIRKIRMGTFEDTGKCKGYVVYALTSSFAFVDFDSAHHATKALIEPRNGRLLGRTLQIEYAGLDAVRRGASKDLLPDYVPTRRRRRPASSTNTEPLGQAASVREDEGETDTAPAASVAAPATPAPRRRGSAAPRRIRPGAANAAAPRQAYGIVPSEGKRTTFAE